MIIAVDSTIECVRWRVLLVHVLYATTCIFFRVDDVVVVRDGLLSCFGGDLGRICEPVSFFVILTGSPDVPRFLGSAPGAGHGIAGGLGGAFCVGH
jgi:hypothetical protein